MHALTQSLIPPALRPIARAIYHKAFRLQLRTEFWCADRLSKAPSPVPVPPAILRYRVSELLSVSEFLRIGAGCASLIRQRVDDMGIAIGSAHRVLDFGCGCGRTIAWLLRDSDAEFHGVDVDRDAVDWCKNNLRDGHFLANASIPPLPYPNEYFDVVYCLSVFTHLNESMQDLWIEELSRILKPGGVLLLTIYGNPLWRTHSCVPRSHSCERRPSRLRTIGTACCLVRRYPLLRSPRRPPRLRGREEILVVKDEQPALQWAPRNRTTARPCVEWRRGVTGKNIRGAGGRSPGSKGNRKSRGAIRATPRCAAPAPLARPQRDRDAASDTTARARRTRAARPARHPIPASGSRAGSAGGAPTAPARRVPPDPTPPTAVTARDTMRAWSRA